jgi:hypothetical protein
MMKKITVGEEVERQAGIHQCWMWVPGECLRQLECPEPWGNGTVGSLQQASVSSSPSTALCFGNGHPQ